ncbi:hypothetical protein FRB99_005498 [Tulasnella sp. 403]|nr:hypothetical protein FRB99_005498 [Tulasnella sp. 403]
MALTSSIDDNAMIAVWQLVTELSEQLNANRAATAALQAQAGALKGQALHNGTGFVLRRYNADLSKEVFESEVERMNAALIIENQQLQHENKQLNVLLKEYEQTLETVMSKFRSQAHAAQQHELTLTRHYESLLLTRESSTMNQDLAASTKISASLSRLSHLIRQAIRANAGDETDDAEPESTSNEQPSGDPNNPNQNESPESDGYSALLHSDREDWALERESEINRLEKENEVLRKLLGIDSSGATVIGATEEEWSGTEPLERRRVLGGGFRGGSVALGRKPSLMGRGGGMAGAPTNAFALQRGGSLGWMDKHSQENLLTRQ